MIVIGKLCISYSPMDLLIPVLLFSLVSSPLFVETLHAPVNTTRTFTAQPPPSFQKQATLGVKNAKVFSFSGNSNAGVPLPPQPKAKPWDGRNSYQIPQPGIFPPIQQRKPNVPPSFQRNSQPNQLMSQTFNRNQPLRAGSSGFPAKQQPFIVTTPVPTPSPDVLGGSQVRFNFKAAKARQAQLARMRTTSPKPSPTTKTKKNINASSFNRFNRFNRFEKPRNKQKIKKPTTPKPEKKYVSGNGVQYTDLSKIAKDGSYMGNQDPLYVYSTTTAPPPTYPPTQPPYRQPYRNNYQNNYYQTTTYGYQYYQTTNNYNYDPYYQGQYQNNNAPYQGNNQQYQGQNNQQYQGNYLGYATTTPYYQDQGYQSQGQYNQGYQNQEGYQYTTPPYYPSGQQNNQGYQNNYGPPAQQGGNFPQGQYSGNQTYSNYNYPGQGPNAQYQPPPPGQIQNTQYQPPPANQASNAQYPPPPGNQAPNPPYQPPPGSQGANTPYQPPPANQAPNAPYQPPPANQAPNTPYQPPPGNQGPNSQYQPPPGNQGANTQYLPPPGNQGPPINQGANNQYGPPPGIQGPNAKSLPPTGIQPPVNQGPPVNPGANGQYPPLSGNQGVNAQYQPPPGVKGQNAQYKPQPGGQPPQFAQGQGPPPAQGQVYQPGQPAQPYPPQGNPPYQTNPQQGSQQPQNISSNVPYQYQPGQGYNDNYIPPDSGGAVPSPEQNWVRIDNIMTTIKPPNNERWVQVGSIKPTWTTQSTITVNQNKKVQETTTRAPPDVAGWSDPAPNPNDINLEIIGDTLLDTPTEVPKSLDINITSKTSAKSGLNMPLRGDIQIGNSTDQISINVKDKLIKTKETKIKVSQSDAKHESKIIKDIVEKTAIKTSKLVPEKAVKENVTTEEKSNVSSLESKAELKTEKNSSKVPKKQKTTTTSTSTTSTTTTPKPTTTKSTTTTTTTPKPTTTTKTTTTTTTTTPKPTTTTPKPTTTTQKPTTTTPKPTTTTTPKPTTTTTPKPTTKKPTTTTTTKAPPPTTKRPEVSPKIEKQANTQHVMEIKPHSSVDVREKITKQSSASVKIETSRKPNSENPTNRILAGKKSVSKTDLLDHTKNINSKNEVKSKVNNSKHQSKSTYENSKIIISTVSKSLKSSQSPKEKRVTLDLNVKSSEGKSHKNSPNKNILRKLNTSTLNNVSNTSFKFKMKSVNHENNNEMKMKGLNVEKTVPSDVPRKININQENSKSLTKENKVVSMDAELVRSFVKLIEHFTALTQPVLSVRHPANSIIRQQNVSKTSFDNGNTTKNEIGSFDRATILKGNKDETKAIFKENRRLPPSEFIKELQSGPRTTPTNIQIIRLSKMEREAQKNYAQRLEKSRMDKLRKKYQRDFKNKLNNVKQEQFNLDSSLLFASQFDLPKEPMIPTKGAIEKLQLNVKSSSLPESLENIMPLPEISTPPPVPLDLDLLNAQFDNTGPSQQNNLLYPMQMREAFEAQIAPQLTPTTSAMFAAFDETSLLRNNDIFHAQKSPVTIDDKFLLNKKGQFDFNSNLQPAFQHVDTTHTETIFTIDGKPLRTKTKTKHSFNSKPIDPRKRNKFLHDRRVLEASRHFLQPEKKFANIQNFNTRETNKVNGLQQNILATLPPTFEKASKIFLTIASNVPVKTSLHQNLSVREKQRTYDVPRGNYQVDTQSQNIKLKHDLIINKGREKRIEMPHKTLNEKPTSNIPHLIQPLNPERGIRSKNVISPPVPNIYQGNGQYQQPVSLDNFNSEHLIPDSQRGLFTVNNDVQHSGGNRNVPELMSSLQTHTETKNSNAHLTNFGNQEQTTTFSEADLLEYLQSGFGPSVDQRIMDSVPYLNTPRNARRNDPKQPVNSDAVGNDKKTTIFFNTATDRIQIEQHNTGQDGYKLQPKVNDNAFFENLDKMYDGSSVSQQDNVLAEKIFRQENVNSNLITTSTPEPRNRAWTSTDTSGRDTLTMENNNKVSNKITSNRKKNKKSKNIMGNKNYSQLVPTNKRTSKNINNRLVVGITDERANKEQMFTSEYVEQSNTMTKNQALNDRTSTQHADKNSRRKIIIKHDSRPVILRKTLVKKIKYVKRKDNVQNPLESVTQTPELTTTIKLPKIKEGEVKLPSVTKSPLEIIEEAKKPSTSLLKKFQQMKYLINLIEVAEKEKLEQNDGTTLGKIKVKKNLNHTALTNERESMKEMATKKVKSRYSTEETATRSILQHKEDMEKKFINLNEVKRKEEIKITSAAKELPAKTDINNKIPHNKTEVLRTSVLKGLQTKVKVENETITSKGLSKKEKNRIKSYTLSTPAFGTSRETRTYLSNQKSVPVFHLPPKIKLQKNNPQTQKTVTVNIKSKKPKKHIRKSLDTKNTKVIDNNLKKTSNSSKENITQKKANKLSFTKINNMKLTSNTSIESNQKEARQINFTKINNIRRTHKNVKGKKSNIKRTTKFRKEYKKNNANKISFTKISNIKRNGKIPREKKKINAKQISFKKISNMKRNSTIPKENKKITLKQDSFTKTTNMKRTSNTPKEHKKIQTKQNSVIKINVNKVSHKVSKNKTLQTTTPHNQKSKHMVKEEMKKMKRKPQRSKNLITSTPKLSKIPRFSGQLEKQKVFSIKQNTVKKKISKLELPKNRKFKMSPTNLTNFTAKADNSSLSSEGRKQDINVGETENHINNHSSKKIISERKIANKAKSHSLLTGSKQVLRTNTAKKARGLPPSSLNSAKSTSMTSNTRKPNSHNKKATTAQLIRKMGLKLSKTTPPKVVLKKEEKASFDNKKMTKVRQHSNKTVLLFKQKNEVKTESQAVSKSNRKIKQNSKTLNKIDSKVSIKPTNNQIGIKYGEKNAKSFTSKTHKTIISPFSTNKFSVKTVRNKDSMISFSPVLKSISMRNDKNILMEKSNFPKINVENKIMGNVNESEDRNKYRNIETPSPSLLSNKTIKVQTPIVNNPKYQSSARRSQRNETVIMSSNSQKDKMATKFRRTGPIRNLTAEENQLLLTQNNSLMNSVEPSNRHILVKILQFLYSNSSDPTSLETIKQEILSTTSKEQQIIIFDILAAYLGGTPPDNSYLVAKNNQSTVQSSAQRGVNVQQRPVLKDSHRYGPPRQDYRGTQYVKAPAVDSHRTNNIGTTVFPSEFTTFPTYPTTKSFWDSLFSFTPTTPFPGNKPGSCPTAFALMFDCHNVCSHDSHCYGRQKCCHGGRGTGCCARPETMDVGFNNLLMPYMMAERQGQGGQNNRFFGEILKKK